MSPEERSLLWPVVLAAVVAQAVVTLVWGLGFVAALAAGVLGGAAGWLVARHFIDRRSPPEAPRSDRDAGGEG